MMMIQEFFKFEIITELFNLIKNKSINIMLEVGKIRLEVGSISLVTQKQYLNTKIVGATCCD